METNNNVGTKIDTAKLVDDEVNVNLHFNLVLWFIGLVLISVAYAGPFLYYKYYKKKNFTAANNIGVKHAI